MNQDLREMTFGIESDLVTSTSLNFRIPSWPPPRDWPVVIDKHGEIIARWGDPRWSLAPWTNYQITLSFGDDKASKKGKAEPLNAENADIMRKLATWLIWGPHAGVKAKTLYTNFYAIRSVVALCNRKGINAANLMRFPKVLEQLPEILSRGQYETVFALLHRIYDARDMLGFSIVNPDGLKRLAASTPDHEVVQTPYIPPRIWLYQVRRLRECLLDFLSHREQIEACFKFCLDAYASRFGSLQTALASCKDGDVRTPFNTAFRKEKWYPGLFSEVAERCGVADILAKWVDSYQSTFDIRVLSAYFTNVTFAGQAYICNFTLQRKEEVGSLRSSCLEWEDDDKLGRVPIICGETTKTDPDSDARWVASPSVEIAIQALSVIAELRMICDRANPLIQPTQADQADPYLLSAATEPWAGGAGGRLYNVRSPIRSIRETLKRFTPLLDSEEMRITPEDLKVAQRLTPNLPTDEFCVGKIWPLGWHQYRRTGCVNMFASGDISDSTIQQQMKHASRLMPLYYGRNHSRLHFNKNVQTAVIMAMYQAQAAIAKIAVTEDRFISPYSPEHKAMLAVNVLSAKDVTALTAMAKKGTVTFREHRLGGCMKAGVCEYGGIESIARCAGGDGGKPCKDVLYDRSKEHLVRVELHRITEEIKLLPVGHPRYHALIDERRAMESYLNAISTNPV